MQTRLIALACVLVSVIGCESATSKPYSYSDWIEKQHPPSDTEKLPAGCKILKYRGNFISIREAIEGSGRHCVVHDFIQRKRIDSINGKDRGSPKYEGVLSFLEGCNVDVDLRGHLISGAPYEDTVGIANFNAKLQSLRVHHGKITSPGKFGVGIFMAPYKFPPNGLGSLRPEDQPPMRNVKYISDQEGFKYSDPWNCQPITHYTAENLQINAGWRGIIMSGADNVVRNNFIEVDGQTAIYLYGPHPIIEGNTFIVHLDKRDQAPLPAILKLLDADGAIIRNNRFIVQGRGNAYKAEAAINLLASKDVMIENNSVNDVRLLVRKDEVSTVIEKDNVLK